MSIKKPNSLISNNKKPTFGDLVGNDFKDVFAEKVGDVNMADIAENKQTETELYNAFGNKIFVDKAIKMFGKGVMQNTFMFNRKAKRTILESIEWMNSLNKRRLKSLLFSTLF